jgi:uncharacterized membrane protein YedE/YeeE
MLQLLSRWLWYVVGALLGAIAPLLLLAGNRQLGVSGNLRTICAALLPRDIVVFDIGNLSHQLSLLRP